MEKDWIDKRNFKCYTYIVSYKCVRHSPIVSAFVIHFDVHTKAAAPSGGRFCFTEEPMENFDYLIVGAGLFGAVFAYCMEEAGHHCLVIDSRNHFGGNCYTEEVDGITVHKYGAHIFNTSNLQVWNFIKRFSDILPFVNSPIAIYKDEVYNLPFNMNTFSKIWNVRTPDEAKAVIESQRLITDDPRNLAEKAKTLVGQDIYEKLIKGYTEKQWGKPCDELPPDLINRLPVRFTYDNNYFNSDYQGIPEHGYTLIFQKLLRRSKVKLRTNYDHFGWTSFRTSRPSMKIVYTGPLDKLYSECYGALDYRSLRFEEKWFDCDNVQGNAVVNYTSSEVPYTRSIEHKHFTHTQSVRSVVTYEYPEQYKQGTIPYYPVRNERSLALYRKYRDKAKSDGYIIGGSMGLYLDMNMEETIFAAINAAKKELGGHQFEEISAGRGSPR